MIESEDEAASRQVEADGNKRGGIVAALRRSPMVGADLDLTRQHEDGRPPGGIFGADDEQE